VNKATGSPPGYLFARWGYALEDAAAGKSVPLQVDELQALIPDGASINVVALPKLASRPLQAG